MNSEKWKNLKNTIIEYIKSFLFSIVVVWLLITFIVYPVKVRGHSMDHTLADGQIGLTFVLNKHLNHIKRFDIVVVKLDRVKDFYVKRIIGMPSDHLKYQNNELFINGQKVKQAFLDDFQVTQDFEITLKDDEYFVLGDNRLNSHDSRNFGPIKHHNIKSSGMFILFPFKHFGLKK